MKPMASACAACMSRRGAPVTMRRRCNTRCAPIRARPAAWAGQAVLDDRTRRGDWAGALATVDSNAAARLIDKPTANRWRAVIKTAMAEASDGARSEGRARLGAGGLPARADARARGGDQRPADGAGGRLSSRQPDARGCLRADAPSRPRRGLSARPPRRFVRGPAGPRPDARPHGAARSRIAL